MVDLWSILLSGSKNRVIFFEIEVIALRHEKNYSQSTPHKRGESLRLYGFVLAHEISKNVQARGIRQNEKRRVNLSYFWLIPSFSLRFFCRSLFLSRNCVFVLHNDKMRKKRRHHREPLNKYLRSHVPILPSVFITS